MWRSFHILSRALLILFTPPPHPSTPLHLPCHHHSFFFSSLPLFFPLCFPLLGPNPLFWPSGQIFSSISPQCEVTQSAPITVLVTEINNLLALQLKPQKRHNLPCFFFFVIFFAVCVFSFDSCLATCDSPVCRTPAVFLPASVKRVSHRGVEASF